MFPDEDDPQTEESSLHGGRVRSFKHERGNWATYVYFPRKSNSKVEKNHSSISSRYIMSCLFVCFFFTPRPSRGGVSGSVGCTAVGSGVSGSGSDPTGRVPPQPFSDSGAQTPLDPAFYTKSQGRLGPLQKVCLKTARA